MYTLPKAEGYKITLQNEGITFVAVSSRLLQQQIAFKMCL